MFCPVCGFTSRDGNKLAEHLVMQCGVDTAVSEQPEATLAASTAGEAAESAAAESGTAAEGGDVTEAGEAAAASEVSRAAVLLSLCPLRAFPRIFSVHRRPQETKRAPQRCWWRPRTSTARAR